MASTPKAKKQKTSSTNDELIKETTPLIRNEVETLNLDEAINNITSYLNKTDQNPSNNIEIRNDGDVNLKMIMNENDEEEFNIELFESNKNVSDIITVSELKQYTSDRIMINLKGNENIKIKNY
jgi:hypothetical protein